MIGVRRLIPIDPDDPAPFDRQSQPAMFQRQCRFAEQLAAPAVQCGYAGIIIRRNLFQIVDGCDHLAGDAMALRRHPQQNFQKLDNRRAI
jgi:hypothetical protein